MPIKKKEKIRYTVDAYNRLAYRGSGRKSKLSQFRTVLDGRWKLDAGGVLTYSITQPSQSRRLSDVKLSGKYSLNSNHDLVLTLDGSRRQKSGDKLTIRGEIINTDAHEIAFSITTKDKTSGESVYILSLRGWWQADDYNRLSFRVERENGSTDTLTFRGTWDINKHHQLVYTYRKRNNKRKSLRTHYLTFKGHWDITSRNRITYNLDTSSDSAFGFGVRFARYDARRRSFIYSLGIGVKPLRRQIVLKGTWKVHQGLRLAFEIKYAEGRVHAIMFGAVFRLASKTELDVKLTTTDGHDLGIEIKLSRSIFNGRGEIFLRAEADSDEQEVAAGVGFRF